ncbi:hypothetical protein [Agitococcus lubricus]|uniref:Uncharacterized protein n=1 Tax=Agitococcus lubricus TaxID=1077255 RepID=A0A2T5IYC5_9GAMM|nr:hypothetical protein [Agitococcus lubricus]PTQ88999.1 hypothetical protein C8N29_10920 [Agitococcus lubricus]
MKATPKPVINPFGYRANSLDQVLCYLTRSVHNIPFASNEELYAAALIHKMRDQIEGLEQELKTIYRKYQQAKQNHAVEQDSLRLQFCLKHGLILDNEHIHSEFDSELVVNGDYRAAIDRLMKT